MAGAQTAAPRGAATREALLAAAQACLRRHGYSRTTARAVAAEAGANLRSIGYHHGSLGALLTEALSRNFRSWLAPLVDGDPESAEAASAQLAAGFARFGDLLADNRPMARAWLEAVALAQDDPDLLRRLAANQRWFAAALARKLTVAGIADGAGAAAAVVTVCDGLMVRMLLHGEAPPPAEVAALADRALRSQSSRN